jgi:hypothetical protein
MVIVVVLVMMFGVMLFVVLVMFRVMLAFVMLSGMVFVLATVSAAMTAASRLRDLRHGSIHADGGGCCQNNRPL